MRRAEAPSSAHPAGPIPDAGKGEGEEDEEKDGTRLGLSTTPRNCIPRRGISVLEKLVKTCPVWLQLGLGQAEAAKILQQEMAGMFLVCRDNNLKQLVLCVHFPSLKGSSAEVLEYPIKEEKAILYLEGSVLVFEDIFRLIAFYCVSRDLLPFTLRLPQAILEASSFLELETISNLGLGFWDSSLNSRGSAEPLRSPAPGTPASSSLRPTTHYANCSCEIELSVGNDRLWFVNPIFIEDCILPADPPPLPTGSYPPRPTPATPDATSPTSKGSPRRPPPPPPLPTVPPTGPARPLAPPVPPAGPLPNSPLTPTSHLAPHAPGPPGHSNQPPMTACESLPRPAVGLGPFGEEEMKPGTTPNPLHQAPPPPLPLKKALPAAPPRRRISERVSLESQNVGTSTDRDHSGISRTASLNLPPQSTVSSLGDRPPRTTEQSQDTEAKASHADSIPVPPGKAKQPPVPPPRKKRVSRQLASTLLSPLESPIQEASSEKQATGASWEGLSPVRQAGMQHLQVQSSSCPQSSPEFKGSQASLSDSLGVPASAADQDSYSTSSAEEELEFSSPNVKKKPSMILDKARHRLSFVSFASVFHAFLSSDRKLYKKVVELAQDKSSYFGSLVQDYKVYSLEMMARQTSSTEMLQEIRTMMTQLKSYLLQSTELKALVEPTLHSEEELEAIVESALYKCVLKPLKEAINSSLLEIHSRDGSLQQLKENQLVVLATTTTDLGVTTSVPEVAVMEKILQKLTSMHKAYSPGKKISILLKTCKLIYDSMALGNPGKPYGADDFLPVLMYVLARSNLTEMLLNVEYMMELMDPALQLGEGSYYLTTTYGALEHIKNYDKITVTRQLSVEVQDSIHRWERRRTLNKARASRSSVQDFICVSYLKPEQQSRTLASRADTAAQALCAQCAEKFEVSQPQDYRLFVLVDGRCFQLADEALPHRIKGYLLRSEPKRDFHFVYRPQDSGKDASSQPCIVVREPNFL
ncbi:ras and Rab interactor 3 isoform 1 [Mus musculus]|uniref:Ras and Rab interactor 3 n=4 Tax=Mus musculus TaxID=10090 RepID=RIN3_MOUSE|nr:ras and Rab interactor 3 isoform 1 [Mus musculus]P59729.2 RecName: Full=Ras and Rab interactor 3; AltName: Full=Ras interaction/interference protein 3 [Mus musculus]AAI37908.1 Ras and Rab interactor 3 [Mus musculus]|eukprot:NP_808288.2 ras and Rab interactor 3 isoform 1 [Mus musculus]